MKKHKGVPLNDETLEEVMTSDFPKVYIHDVVDNPDETCSITFDTNKAFDDLYKKEKNRKRISKKGIGEFFIELLKKGLDKEDEYDIKKVSELYKLTDKYKMTDNIGLNLIAMFIVSAIWMWGIAFEGIK